MAGQHGYRIRAGDYRIVYDTDDRAATASIVNIGHRREIYEQATFTSLLRKNP